MQFKNRGMIQNVEEREAKKLIRKKKNNIRWKRIHRIAMLAGKREHDALAGLGRGNPDQLGSGINEA